MGNHFLPLILVGVQLALLALIVYGILRGIRWAVAHGVRDAQKMADHDRIAAAQVSTQPPPVEHE